MNDLAARLQNEPVRLECRQWISTYVNKGGYTYGASFKRCGWKAVITADNRRELLSVRLKDSWERDLLPAQSA